MRPSGPKAERQEPPEPCRSAQRQRPPIACASPAASHVQPLLPPLGRPPCSAPGSPAGAPPPRPPAPHPSSPKPTLTSPSPPFPPLTPLRSPAPPSAHPSVAVPLALSHPPAELAYVLQDAGVSVVLAQEEFAAVLRPLLKADGCNASLVDLGPAAPGKARAHAASQPPLHPRSA